jgi:hypothetical protein
LGTALIASLAAQGASYAVLVPCYLFTADTRLFAHVQRDSKFIKSQDTIIYYSGSDNQLYQMRLGSGIQERLPQNKFSFPCQLLVSKLNGHSNHWSLWSSDEHGTLHLVIDDIGGPDKIVQGHEATGAKEGEHLNGTGGDQLLNQVGSWRWEHIADLSVDIPFLESFVYSGFLLPSEQGVFCWNPGFGRSFFPVSNPIPDPGFPSSSQIFAIDLKTRKIARIARGSSIVVVTPRAEFGHVEWNGGGTEKDR